ncbi:hypothetical protein [Haloferula sp. A504]|uniref:HzsA-related protein n=1 Tax=Haloferula sp. A504 TaxID=3373601 RepID=UPI0031BCBF31|nr:hypothetical protein [Verrucomicrobiaceae bacterium E54]
MQRRATLLLLVLALAGGSPAGELEDLAKDLRLHREGKTDAARLAREALHPASLIHPGDQTPVQVIQRRTRALMHDLGLDEPVPDDPAALLALRRRVAFGNPLLDFTDILFLKHHKARYDHMVDQYFGFNAKPGGGVFILRDAFGPDPRVENLLEHSVVTNGRLKGRKLEGGSFISLELSYAGDEILFAWTEAEVPVKPTDRTPREDLWKPESTYHIFKARIDGSGLTQLTDGEWNDFDPCYLPDGRICFVSERRGGFLRCGVRPDPTYTLHSMNADGSDLRPLSFHETHEWHPSVTHEGMIVYTRWDYVDRDSDIAHHPWITYPDGRDPRALHGNYPKVREQRPWMEMAIRAVPGSTRFVAVAAPHHGQNYGSIVLIDPEVEDDDAMSQVRRVTPEIHFPESEVAPGVPGRTHGGRHSPKAEVYGTPWPLSETYHLCVHDRGQKNHGLYLLDAFGNRELLYRDPEIPCLDPIPLRSRPRPAVIPTRTQPGKKGHLLVADVYESRFEWPPDTKIAALRLIQLFPKTTPAMKEPNIGIGDQSLARGIVGHLPVEADGSVYGEAPVGVPFYMQAVDEGGFAIQSMRSATYVHPGETLSCVGCHEGRNRTGLSKRSASLLALQRPPSSLYEVPDGAFPLSFPRLVQPVLDRHCVECHANEPKALELDGKRTGKHGWTASYANLAPFGWAKHGGNGALKRNGSSRSEIGDVGARASRLMRLLAAGHHGVKLPPDDVRRLALWLDANSNFYGAYHNLEEQARGEHVMPSLY